MKKKKIGFFGGTFDPIHFGHINLALQILEAYPLDEVVFCPVFCSPFKTKTPPIASGVHRLNMVELAIQPIRQFRSSSMEIERGVVSYTIDTIQALSQEGELYLLLSDEAALHLQQWHEVEKLLELAPPLVGVRTNQKWQIGEGVLGEALRHGAIPTRVLEISSTEIRERIKKRLHCSHLVPAKSLDYIQTHHLYS